jgi:hypothetical protein
MAFSSPMVAKGKAVMFHCALSDSGTRGLILMSSGNQIRLLRQLRRSMPRRLAANKNRRPCEPAGVLMRREEIAN